MKLNLDAEPENLALAFTVSFEVIRDNPNQEEGVGNAVYLEKNGIRFQCVKNEESYTVREVTEEEELQLV